MPWGPKLPPGWFRGGPGGLIVILGRHLGAIWEAIGSQVAHFARQKRGRKTSKISVPLFSDSGTPPRELARALACTRALFTRSTGSRFGTPFYFPLASQTPPKVEPGGTWGIIFRSICSMSFLKPHKEGSRANRTKQVNPGKPKNGGGSAL